MQRDRFECRDCGDSESTLNVHHCAYEERDPWNTDARLLLTLCEECHDTRGKLEGKARAALGKIFVRSTDLQSLVESLEKIAVEHEPVLFLFPDSVVFPLMSGEAGLPNQVAP